MGPNEDRAEFMAARFKLGFVVGFQGSGAGGRGIGVQGFSVGQKYGAGRNGRLE